MKNRILKFVMVMALSVVLVGSMVACSGKDGAANGETSAESKTEKGGEFAEFSGEDLDGNKIDQSLLKENKLTVLNFWFNGCSACVSEMPELEKLSQEWKEKGVGLVGVNVEVQQGGQKVIDEAKEILKKQGVTYKNVALSSGDKATEYMGSLVAYPTTILVDQDGNIVGQEICGSINSEDTMKALKEMIDNALK